MNSRLLTRFLWAALDCGLGRSYGHTGETQDCIRFQFATLVGMYPEVDLAAHHRVLHLNGESLGSVANMEKLVALGLGEFAHSPDLPGVYAMQGWQGGGGHAVFLVKRKSGELWIAEFTTRTADGFEAVSWGWVTSRWSQRALVRLRAPSP